MAQQPVRHDGRQQVPGKYGKPGSSYPKGDKNYPQVTEVETVAKGTTGFSFLDPHPKFSSLVLTYMQRDKGDDNTAVETRGYEQLPGAQVMSFGYDEHGDLETTYTQTILNNGEFDPIGTAEGAMQYLFNSAEAVGIDVNRATATVKTVEHRANLYIEEAFTTNRTLMRHITGTRRTTTIETVPIGTPPVTGFLVVESRVEDKTKWLSTRTTTRVDAFTQLVSEEYSPAAHGALTVTTETIVPTGTIATGTITFASNPSDGDTVTINDQVNGAKVFTFRTTPTVAGDVGIDSTANDTADNLQIAISNTSPLFITATVLNNVVTITSVYMGVIGNAVTLAKSNTNPTLSGAHLTGGAQAVPVALSLTVLSSHTEDLDGTHALQHVVTLATNESWPTIRRKRIDPQSAAVIWEDRSIVAAGTVTPSALINYSVLTIVNFSGAKALFITMDDGTVDGVINNLTINPGVSAAATAIVVANAINAITNMPVKAVALDATVTIHGTYEPFIGPAYIGWAGSSDAYFFWSEPLTAGVTPFMISTGHYAQLTGVALVSTSEEQVDEVKSYKVVTTRFDSPHHDVATAVLSTKSIAHRFPSLYNFSLENTHQIAGFNWFEKDATIIPATLQTFWVIGAKPEVDYDRIITGSVCIGDNRNVLNVLHDAYVSVINIEGVNVVVSYPETTPAFSAFFGLVTTVLSGLVSLTQGSATMTGNGSTLFTSELHAGDVVYVGNYAVTIASDPTDDHSATLSAVSLVTMLSPSPLTKHTTSGTAWPGTDRCIDFDVADAGYGGLLWRVTRILVTIPAYV